MMVIKMKTGNYTGKKNISLDIHMYIYLCFYEKRH